MTGFLNVLKPPGMTSSDVVTVIRRILNVKRIGHTGTLDPGAAGVLPLCLGRATRLFDLLADKQKEYIAEITLGKSTDTQDSYGKITFCSDNIPSVEQLKEVLPLFCGRQLQTAPLFSAVKINGVASYKLARKGADIHLRQREADIDIEYLEKTGANSYLLKIICSKGTYIRTLCNDIGEKLACGAYMSFLLRTRSGSFNVADSVTIDEIEAAERKDMFIQSPDTALFYLPECIIPLRDKKKLIDGSFVPAALSIGGKARLYCENEFIGIGTVCNETVKLDILLTEEHGDTNEDN